MRLRKLVSRVLLLAAVASLLIHPGASAGAQTPAADVARDYLQRQAAALGLTAADISDVAVSDSVVSAHTGVTHVYLRQRQGGIPVLDGLVNVNVARDGQ
jgi:extracellular elastinolytic metalloproteinase